MKINFTSIVFKKSVYIFSVFILFLQCCTCSEGSSSQDLNDAGATEASKSALISANNQFAWELYAHLKDQESGKNIFFSPISIFMALGMTYEGAKEETAREIESVFHFSEDDNVRRPSMAAIFNALNSDSSDYVLSIANALWVQKDYPLLDEITKIIPEYYGGQLENLDFINEAEKSRTTINDWIEDKTRDKIQNAVQPGMLHALTRLVLTNAIYFKGNWEKAFDEKDTQKEDFKVNDSETVKVDMMSLTKKEFPYAETEALQILEMPYKGDKLSMLVLLPKNNNISSLEQGLSISQLNGWKSQLKTQEVDIYIPKFKFKSEYQLKDQLTKMGMPLAFTAPGGNGGADFSGFTGNKDLYIDFVTHLAFVDVNEEGTEAAAATIVGVKTTSVRIDRPPVFRADHPFIFLIQEKKTGQILFIGRVINPNL